MPQSMSYGELTGDDLPADVPYRGLMNDAQEKLSLRNITHSGYSYDRR